MIEIISDIFSGLSSMLTMSPAAVLSASFVWGMISILLSPCHLSSIPLAIGYINGRGKMTQSRVFLLSLLFSAGVLLSLLTIGAATSAAGRMIGDTGKIFSFIAGIIFMLVGLSFFDIIRLPQIPRMGLHIRPGSFPGAFFLGLLFGAALGPCTFGFMIPVLAAAFQTAHENIFYAVMIVFSFAAGHSIVIIFAGTALNRLQSVLNWEERSKGIYWFRRICGTLIIAAGLYLILKLF